MLKSKVFLIGLILAAAMLVSPAQAQKPMMDASGQQIKVDKGKVRESTEPVYVGEAGVIINLIHVDGGDCCREILLMRRSGKYVNEYQRFAEIKELDGYHIAQPGVYYIQPILRDRPGCLKVRIEVAYTTPDTP